MRPDQIAMKTKMNTDETDFLNDECEVAPVKAPSESPKNNCIMKAWP